MSYATSLATLNAESGPHLAASISEAARAPQPRLLWPAVVVSAVLTTLAFPPSDYGWSAWLALSPLFWAVVRAHRPRRAFALGYLFGLIHFGSLTPWIGVAVATWSGNRLGWIAWVLLTGIQALWYGGFAMLAWWVHRRTAGDARILVLALAWVLVEWLRGVGGLAMPWGLIGYTQHRALSIIQVADATGVYGVSLLIAVVNAAIAASVKRDVGDPARSSGPRRRSFLRFAGLRAEVGILVLPCFLYAGALTYGLLCAGLPWQGQPVVVAVVQPNTEDGRARLGRTETMQRLAAAAASLQEDAPSLTVWPEGAAPADAVNDLDVSALFSSFAGTTGGYHLTGTGYFDERGREHNSAALFAPESGLIGRYDKERLVPFGEWVPARGLFAPLAQVFSIPEEDLVPGARQAPLRARDMRLGTLICYESIFPGMSRARVKAGANILVGITNDSWAGKSASPAQHFAMTTFRAVETRRYVCVAALTGISGIVRPNGTTKVAEPYTQALVSDLIYMREGSTPYVRWGDWLVAVGALCLAWTLVRRPGTVTP